MNNYFSGFAGQIIPKWGGVNQKLEGRNYLSLTSSKCELLKEGFSIWNSSAKHVVKRKLARKILKIMSENG